MKIKWNDDRVSGATTAVLLLVREQLARGSAAPSVAAALAEYRADLAAYKLNKKRWPEARELGPLTRAEHVAYYRNLVSAVDRLTERMTRAKRQFNSLLELDNYLVSMLERVK